MSLYEEILKKNEKVSLVGLGYVGMPIAVAFSKQVEVIGFDVNAHKIELYKKGIDPTNEVGDEAIAKCTVEFTSQNCVRQNFILSQYRLRLTLTIHRILHQSREQVMLWDEILPKDLL